MLHHALTNLVATFTANPGISKIELDQAVGEISHPLPLD